MKTHEYKSYEEYVKCQVSKTEWAFKNVWANKTVIEAISSYIKDNNEEAKFGICHGVRSGWECVEFNKELGIEVIGTELADVENDSCVINWDFHKLKDEWVGSVDFIYSNSFDHSCAPDLCLRQWMKCINKNGHCFIEWTTQDTSCNDIDCFGASKEEYYELFSLRYNVVEMQLRDKRNTLIFVLSHK